MCKQRKLILYISMSLDGFIADSSGDLEFLSLVEQEGEDYGYFKFVESVDTVIIGRKTYDKVRSMGFEYPHSDKDVYIITRTAKPAEGKFQYFTGNLVELVSRLKSQSGKHIYCDGGAQIVNLLKTSDLIDEYIISVIPVILGQGIRLFDSKSSLQKLKLISSNSFDSGLVQVRYERKN